MKVVLPVLYCPSSSTEGFASKSDSVNSEEKKLPNLYASSSGRICVDARPPMSDKVNSKVSSKVSSESS